MRSEDGFSFSRLGERFSPDEMGRLVRLQQDRQNMQNNGREVLADAASALIARRLAREAKESGDWQGELAARRAQLKKKQDARK